MSNQPTVTILPSEQILSAENAVHVITDETGRSISIKKPGILDQFDLIEVLGDAAENNVYRSMCIPLLYVSAIDGQPVMKVGSNGEMRALIQRLDEHGFKAVQEGIKQHFTKKPSQGGDEEAIKK
ncbi:hypothetical protein [Herbaspirillum sp. YR522]|uniref:hypothetical protein n=1 Tax=Herbaspirillum sp. YR522 TaxID=1144342 RepID=UPI00026FAAEE|nr:hypothetical protein [Herbaspirillum sp. YR522]EJN07787.1 hypothetical protein PMI40_01683 [Herbaspirillum sp. YR522]